MDTFKQRETWVMFTGASLAITQTVMHYLGHPVEIEMLLSALGMSGVGGAQHVMRSKQRTDAIIASFLPPKPDPMPTEPTEDYEDRDRRGV